MKPSLHASSLALANRLCGYRVAPAILVLLIVCAGLSKDAAIARYIELVNELKGKYS